MTSLGLFQIERKHDQTIQGYLILVAFVDQANLHDRISVPMDEWDANVQTFSIIAEMARAW